MKKSIVEGHRKALQIAYNLEWILRLLSVKWGWSGIWVCMSVCTAGWGADCFIRGWWEKTKMGRLIFLEAAMLLLAGLEKVCHSLLPHYSFRTRQLVGQSGLVVCFTVAIQIPPFTNAIQNLLFHGPFQSLFLLPPLYASLPFTNLTLEEKSSL